MLLEFLETKPLYYAAFDPQRIYHAYESIKNNITLPKIIHIIGTNGKGTTGRYLAQMLIQAGYTTGHYTSPHIHEFNERIWMNGNNLSYELLEEAFCTLNTILNPTWQASLSYFEYTTLLAMVAFESCDYVVLEAGLGGEFDATAIFDNILTVITPIGMDHQDFLGSTLEAIVQTKLNAIRHRAVIALQSSEAQAQIDAYVKEHDLDAVWVGEINTEIASLSLPLYLKKNMQTALTAFLELNIEHEIAFASLQTLKGRFYSLNDKIRLDVGHNPLAAQALKEALGKSKVILVYNSYKDKAYGEILTILKENIKHVEIINVEDDRIVSLEALEKTLDTCAIAYKPFRTIDPNEEYLVFGSFSVVETFLEVYHV